MTHPIRWAHVERWSGFCYTEWLVDPVLVRTFRDFEQPVIVG